MRPSRSTTVARTERVIHIHFGNAISERLVACLAKSNMSTHVIGSDPKWIDYAVRRNVLNIFTMGLGEVNLPAVAECVIRIRTHANLNIKLSPIIVFIDNPSFDTVKNLINTGIDDVIVGVPKPADLVRRLSKIYTKPVDFFETDTYFGPDRRRNFRQSSSTLHPKKAPKRHMLVARTHNGCFIIYEHYQGDTEGLDHTLVAKALGLGDFAESAKGAKFG